VERCESDSDRGRLARRRSSIGLERVTESTIGIAKRGDRVADWSRVTVQEEPLETATIKDACTRREKPRGSVDVRDRHRPDRIERRGGHRGACLQRALARESSATFGRVGESSALESMGTEVADRYEPVADRVHLACLVSAGPAARAPAARDPPPWAGRESRANGSSPASTCRLVTFPVARGARSMRTARGSSLR
jgi:hypothetical protein